MLSLHIFCCKSLTQTAGPLFKTIKEKFCRLLGLASSLMATIDCIVSIWRRQNFANGFLKLQNRSFSRMVWVALVVKTPAFLKLEN